jgi:hypothetical protein
MWIELSLQKKKVVIGVGYRPPRQSLEEVENFLDHFQTSLTAIMARAPESIIVMGDFNDRCTTWDSVHELSNLKNDFFDMINVSDMVQLINEPTHWATHANGVTESLLDLIITDSPGYVIKSEVLPPLCSNHATLYLEFKISYPRNKSYVRHVWDYEKGNYANLNLAISGHLWDETLANADGIDNKTTSWTSSFLEICKGYIPNRDIRVRPMDLPWITPTCKRLIRVRNRAFKKFQRSKAGADGVV